MSPLIPIETWNQRRQSATMKPRARCFIVAEGANTEFWYLSRLAAILSKRNLPERIEIKPVERTDTDRNKSHPKALASQARAIRDDAEGIFGFDKNSDRIVIVFDADVYKGKEQLYAEDLKEFEGIAQVAVTNPSFELFLLLHIENAVALYIDPNRDKILENNYCEGTKRRFISKLANDALGMNVKTNSQVALLADRFEVAVRQEKELNQNAHEALGSLTSNIAKTIEELIRDGSECSL